jgi:hypothetical protein
MIWTKGRTVAYDHGLYDSVRGGGSLIYPSLSQAASTVTNGIQSFDADGVTFGANNKSNASDSTYVAWAWKADDNEPTIYGSDAETIYKFEDNINDVTGKNNGGSSNVTYTTGKFNKAASFNGTTSYAYSSSTFSGINSSQFSVSCWVKFDTIGTNENIIMGRYTYTNSDQQFIIRISANGQWQLSKYFGNGGGEGLTTTETASTNTWYHVVSVYDNTKMSIYVDGVLLKTEVGAGVANASPTSKLHIGGYEALANNDSSRMDGLIDQIRIYNGVLGQTQVTELYNETASDNDDVILGGPPETIISANANAGFSIVKYTGNGIAGNKIPHGLSSTPEMIIVKNLAAGENWAVYHSATGVNNVLFLNSSGTSTSVTGKWSGTNSTVFGVNSAGDVNQSGAEHIAYCFHSVSNYSKIGSYSGTGSAGNAQNVGFTPDWLMVKRYVGSASQWIIIDSVRGTKALYADLANTESSESRIFLNSTGFEFTGSAFNESSTEWIYMAFKIN